MFDEKSKQIGRLLLVLDMLLTVLVFLLSYRLREFFFAEDPADFSSYIALLPIILVLLGFSLSYLRAYQGLRIDSIIAYNGIVFRAMALSMIALLILLFLLKVQYVSRLVIVMFAGLDILVLVGIRAALIWWYFKRSVEKDENYLKVLIIGTGERAERLSRALHKDSEWGIDIVGHLDLDPERVGSKIVDAPVIGTINDISSILKDHVIDEVILAIPRAMIDNVQVITDACEEEGVKLRFMADFFDLQVARIRLDDLGGIPLLTLEPVAHNEVRVLVKRLMDLIVTLLSMPIVLPIMILVAIAIKLDSKGPVFFKQERVGLRKRIFPMLKFRSMYEGSDQKIKELEHLNEAEGPIFKIANDPRITRVGNFLRKTSLDELPQLFNVIRGHMSLVGPRPMSLRDVDLFDKGSQRKRFSVRPGLTCIWQISGRSNLPFEKWLELDLNYIENWSLGLDIKILIKTIPVVLKGSGAV